MSETDETFEDLDPRPLSPRSERMRVSLGALVGLALTAFPAAALLTGFEAPRAWLVGSGILGVLVIVAIASRRKLLVTYHEFTAWRRQQRFDCWMRVANQLLEVQEYTRAAQWYRRLVDAYPSSVEARYGYAKCLEEAKAFEEASKAYEQAHGIASGGDGGMLASAVKCALEADERDRAAELFLMLAERDRNFANNLLEQAEYRQLRADERIGHPSDKSDQGSTTPYT